MTRHEDMGAYSDLQLVHPLESIFLFFFSKTSLSLTFSYYAPSG